MSLSSEKTGLEEPPAEGEKGGRSDGERRGEGTGKRNRERNKYSLEFDSFVIKYTVMFRAQGITQRNILCQTLSSKMLSTIKLILYSLHKLVQVNYSQVKKTCHFM